MPSVAEHIYVLFEWGRYFCLHNLTVARDWLTGQLSPRVSATGCVTTYSVRLHSESSVLKSDDWRPQRFAIVQVCTWLLTLMLFQIEPSPFFTILHRTCLHSLTCRNFEPRGDKTEVKRVRQANYTLTSQSEFETLQRWSNYVAVVGFQSAPV